MEARGSGTRVHLARGGRLKPHRIYRVAGSYSDYDEYDEWTVAYALERSRADELLALVEKERDDAAAWLKAWISEHAPPREPTASDVLSWQREQGRAVAPDPYREFNKRRDAALTARLVGVACPRLAVTNYRLEHFHYHVDTMLDDPYARCCCKWPKYTEPCGLDLPAGALVNRTCPFHGDA